ncbi:MAG: metalloregulator ArsR/SmtB family transcription factor [Actinomycetota bacterium]|nr:metalloregulator ArsR/SmtB family transcription factor [Actinomycetota bacterium]
MVEDQRDLDAVFRALADPTRRSIVLRLTSGDATVSELAGPYDMSLAAVSKHLQVLQHAGLMEQRRLGRRRQCSLNARRLRDAYSWLSQYERFWDARLEGLVKHFEQGDT